MSLVYRWIVVCELLVLFGACSNPVQIKLPVPSPETIIEQGPKEGSTITVPDISFRWKGLNRFVSQFTYRLNEGKESPWETTTGVTFTLDDGDYIFSVRGRIPSKLQYAAVEDTTPETRHFTVDAVRGPTIVLQPRYMELTSNTTVDINVLANEVTDLFLAHIVLNYDPSKVRVQQITQGNLFNVGGGNIVFLDSLNVPSGLVIVDTGLAAGTFEGVSDTGSLVRLTVTGIAPGDTKITIDPRSRLRRTDNTDISLNPAVSGRLIIR